MPRSGHTRGPAPTALHYVCDSGRGIRREPGRGGFKYFGPDGRQIRHQGALTRIRKLAIPPAWTDVWICIDPRGHLQATGRDARGRKQYRYHPEWRAHREETKFDRLQAFAAALPRIRARTAADLARRGLSRQKVLAAVVRLLETTHIRIGNDEYARHNRSFGLTTLLDSHAQPGRTSVRFSFRGKGGKRHAITVADAKLARIVRQCRDLPGEQLFQYLDEDGRCRDLTAADVNAYLKEITGQEFTAKDFRTWAGTVLAATALSECAPAPTKRETKTQVLRAVDTVAAALGNTRAVCRKSYIHPAILATYMNGARIDVLRPHPRSRSRGSSAKLRQEEAAVLEFLKRTA